MPRTKSFRQYQILHLACTLLLFVIPLIPGTASGNDLFGQENSVWVQSKFFRGHAPSTKAPLTQEDVQALAKTLKRAGIRYAYMFAGPYDKDGSVPAYASSETARKTVQTLKSLYPELVILPWLGGLQDKTVFLDQPAWVKRAVDETVKLIETLKVPGIHLDFEYILPTSTFVIQEQSLPQVRSKASDYGPNLVEFHKLLRRAAPRAFISTVVPSTAPGIQPWKKQQSVEEVAGLAKYSDQVALLYYDTSLKTQEGFESNLRKQLQHIKGWKERLPDTQYLIGTGTFVNYPELHKYRDLKIENLDNHFRTLKRELRNFKAPYRLADGIAIFCEWQTEPEEWEKIRALWSEASAEARENPRVSANSLNG